MPSHACAPLKANLTVLCSFANEICRNARPHAAQSLRAIAVEHPWPMYVEAARKHPIRQPHAYTAPAGPSDHCVFRSQ